ncbi:MAG TPA: glycosyltransferase family 39 protein [Verrucomicrobiae bacterium]|jgi:4-amino-4-deoxy-L-arabinose transferase-like glycosyltransferase|nr:glycosyltransferase family 39 protein [Verrucomicrobiae bacterium]
MLSFLRQTSPLRLAIFLLFALTCYRLWFITQMQLVPDEAYYWLWSKHLAASYRDKGPGIAWTIALGTKLFGNTVFGIRFFAVFLSTATGALIFLLARRLYDDRVALWCVVLASVIPLMAVGSILMTIDSLSVFFWALAIVIFWKALHRDKISDWFWLGLAIGAGFLAKFTNGVQLGCIGFFLLWSKEHRPLLFSRKILVLGVAFGLCILPILWWNIQTGWVHAIALHSRSGVTNTFQIHPGQLLKFIGGQFGVMSPLIMAGIFTAAGALLFQRHTDLRVRFLLSQFLPVYGLFMFFSLNSAGKENWAAPALVTGIIFTVAYWREVVARHPAWRWGVGAAFAIALLMTVVMHNTEPVMVVLNRITNHWHWRPISDPLRRAQGWTDFAAHVQQAREKYGTSLLIANHYSQASMMAFYLPDQPTTYLPPEKYGASQFTLWPGYQLQPDTRALFVTDSTKDVPPKTLQDGFGKIELVDDFWAQHHGHPMTRFRIYLCTRD